MHLEWRPEDVPSNVRAAVHATADGDLDATPCLAPERAPATITDVAIHAGVSRSTVSRVLNGSSHASDRARSAVLRSVAALHYVPNENARWLAQRKVERDG